MPPHFVASDTRTDDGLRRDESFFNAGRNNLQLPRLQMQPWELSAFQRFLQVGIHTQEPSREPIDSLGMAHSASTYK